jgi:phage terminase large subunit-like protein
MGASSDGAPIGLGTGLIPADAIINTSPKSGLPGAIDTAWIRHTSGGVSALGFKSYGKDRDSFEGTEKDLIWLDEEPPEDVKGECSVRLMATKPGQKNGLFILTFTPLAGYTGVVNDFLESSDPDKWYITIGWKDVPHLTPEIIEQMSRKFLPYELKARSEGIPSAGEGAIYPIDIEDLLIDDFELPGYYPRAFGLDVGKTAAVWGALNRETDILYFYREYFSEVYDTMRHGAAIRGVNDRNAWIPGVVDPSSLQSSQIDGRKLIEIYKDQERLDLQIAVNSVEAGIQEVWTRMVTGRLKVFRSLLRWKSEFGRYHRRKQETDNGERSVIVKKFDHLMDAGRYLVVSGIDIMRVKPVLPAPREGSSYSELGWKV